MLATNLSACDAFGDVICAASLWLPCATVCAACGAEGDTDLSTGCEKGIEGGAGCPGLGEARRSITDLAAGAAGTSTMPVVDGFV